MERPDVHDFSMKELAAESGTALTTAFAHFGSKGGVMRAVADRLLEHTAAAYAARRVAKDPVERILLMAEVGVRAILARQEVYRVVCAHILMAHDDHDTQSWRFPTTQLWSIAIDDAPQVDSRFAGSFIKALPLQLAVMFRGAVAVWIAEELSGDQLRTMVINGVVFSLLGLMKGKTRDALLERLSDVDPPGTEK